jgi:hypothetical protein
VLQNTPSLVVPLTATLGRVNEASFPALLICCYYELRRCVRRILGRRLKAYRGADKSLARPTSRCILFDGENILFDASLVIYIYTYIYI